MAPVQPFDQTAPLPPLGAEMGVAQPGPTATGQLPDISSAPPPLSSLTGVADASTTATTAPLASAGGPIETYVFLYREDSEMGVLREMYSAEEAEQRKKQEIQRLVTKYQQPELIGAPQQGQQGVDPRAAAEWDFYFEQMELYSKYVKEKVLRTESPDLPQPSYEASTAYEDAERLEESYKAAAFEVVNEQWNENREFYERLQEREDKRREYRIWVSEREREVSKWAEQWSRKVNGQNWTDGQPVTRDDWYYGVHANAANPYDAQVGGQAFLISRQPQHNVPEGTLNVLSTNLTPYDIMDNSGSMKNPATERLRGTIVRPTPMPLVDSPLTGSVELAL